MQKNINIQESSHNTENLLTFAKKDRPTLKKGGLCHFYIIQYLFIN